MQKELLKTEFKNAHYIKLGSKGKWAEDCLEKRKVRIGWSYVNIQDVHNENWEKIKTLIEEDYQKRGKKNGATQDFKALEKFCTATSDDVFITFGHL
jgi:ribosomal protein RSM22 (predicted rRNA methylase)